MSASQAKTGGYVRLLGANTVTGDFYTLGVASGVKYLQDHVVPDVEWFAWHFDTIMPPKNRTEFYNNCLTDIEKGRGIGTDSLTRLMAWYTGKLSVQVVKRPACPAEVHRELVTWDAEHAWEATVRCCRG